MMNKKLVCLMFGALLAVCTVARCQNLGVVREITLEIKDDEDAVVSDATAKIYFWQPGQKKSPVYEGQTDDQGEYSAKDRVIVSVEAKASKSGYYSIDYHRVQKERMDDATTPIRKKIIMRRVIDPTSLYARKVTQVFPENNALLGFDFKVGDWVKPHGLGQISDILFKATRVFEGFSESEKKLNELRNYTKRVWGEQGNEWTEESFKDVVGNWGGLLEISFAQPQEGIQLCDQEYYVESVLRMPHKAPLDGYQANWDSELLQQQFKQSGKPNLGFFIRTRVMLDNEGELESANYAKFNEAITFDPKKNTISFQYHFNPVANDRNLEFDPQRNLFRDLGPSEGVYSP